VARRCARSYLRYRLTHDAQQLSLSEKDHFVESASRRVPMGELISDGSAFICPFTHESVRGGTLTLDARSHDFGVSLLVPESAVSDACRPKWVRAETVTAADVRTLRAPNRTMRAAQPPPTSCSPLCAPHGLMDRCTRLTARCTRFFFVCAAPYLRSQVDHIDDSTRAMGVPLSTTVSVELEGRSADELTAPLTLLLPTCVGKTMDDGAEVTLDDLIVVYAPILRLVPTSRLPRCAPPTALCSVHTCAALAPALLSVIPRQARCCVRVVCSGTGMRRGHPPPGWKSPAASACCCRAVPCPHTV
jgi:hypothetical protein